MSVEVDAHQSGEFGVLSGTSALGEEPLNRIDIKLALEDLQIEKILAPLYLHVVV